MSSSIPSTTDMWREIHEQPEAIRRALAGATGTLQQIAAEVARREIRLIILAARGTSDHAALYAQYLFQYLNGIPVALATPSIITLYGASLQFEHTLVIGISQSGAAPDVVEVVTQARSAGALTIGITNQEGSALANSGEYALYCAAGKERSVAATKTYTTTCALLALLAASLPGGDALRPGIEQLPELTEIALRGEGEVARVVERYVHARDCVVLGRGFQYSTARETALKLTETCYMISLPFSTADFRHGPAALVERGLPIVLFAPPGQTFDDTRDLLNWLHAQGADSIVVSDNQNLLDMATSPLPITLPQLGSISGKNATKSVEVAETLAPLPYIVYGQLLALNLSLRKGLNPDQPRSLTKVTRTF